MRVKGVLITESPVKVYVLRPDDPQPVTFYAKALQDWAEFDTLCPEPSMPQITVAGKGVVDDSDNKNFLSVLAAYNVAKNSWVAIKSLEPSDIEWSMVDLKQPSTWSLWRKDLRKGGLTVLEITQIDTWLAEVNNLDEEKLRKAREVFQQRMDQS